VGALGTGTRMRPHLFKELRTHDGIVVQQALPEVVSVVDAPEEALATVREGMRMVLEPGGTAGRARVPCVTVGGKTGSAEWKKGELTHGLFVGCAPMEDPEIAIAVVVENAGHGGSVAAPIAGAVLRYYFDVVSPKGECKERPVKVIASEIGGD
jgi:penicillin-binding protein 2